MCRVASLRLLLSLLKRPPSSVNCPHGCTMPLAALGLTIKSNERTKSPPEAPTNVSLHFILTAPVPSLTYWGQGAMLIHWKQEKSDLSKENVWKKRKVGAGHKHQTQSIHIVFWAKMKWAPWYSSTLCSSNTTTYVSYTSLKQTKRASDPAEDISQPSKIKIIYTA